MPRLILNDSLLLPKAELEAKTCLKQMATAMQWVV